MLYVISNSYNPFFNLACEEFLLKYKTEEYFLLWRSIPSVIVGKHQNLLAEINYQYIRENDIKVARRLTGGGTVVHDHGNLNFTFITNGIPGKLIDFKKHVTPIVKFLQSLGIPAGIGEKNDIRIGELKISGNAEHVYKNRVLHHGTLLYNSDLEQLRNAIKVVPGKYFDKAVQSNRASVVNISGFLRHNLSVEEFTDSLLKYLAKSEVVSGEYNISMENARQIEELMHSKYANDDWIWGYSPKYIFRNAFEIDRKQWSVNFEVEKGIILIAEVMIDNIQHHDLSVNLTGNPHCFNGVQNALLKSISMNSERFAELIYYFF